MSLSKIKVNNNQVVGVDEILMSNSDELIKNSGIGKNVYDTIKYDYNISGYLDSSGILEVNLDCRTTDFIKVSTGDIFSVKGQINRDACIVAGYSSDNQNTFVSVLLSYGNYSQLTDFVIPDGINYIRACSAFISGWTPGELYKCYNSNLNVTKLDIDIVFDDSEGFFDVTDTSIRFSHLILRSKKTGVYSKITDDIHNYDDINEIIIDIHNGGIVAIKRDDFIHNESCELLIIPISSSEKSISKIDPSIYIVLSLISQLNGFTLFGDLFNDVINYTKLKKEIVTQSIINYPNQLNLEGKKVVFFGDSITAAGIYEAEFENLTGCISYNRGLGGTTFAQVSSSLLWNESLAERVNLPAQEGTSSSNKGLPSNPDIIFVFAGSNDWGRVAKNNEEPVPAGGGSYQPSQYITNERFGNMNVEDVTTYCGAIRYVFRRLKTKFPSVPIIAVLPLHNYSPNQYPLWSELRYETYSDEGSTWEIQKTTSDNKTYYDYRNAITEIAKIFGIPVIDTFEMGITPILTTDFSAYYNEGLHPNSAGYHLLGKFIYNQMIKIFSLK